MMTTVSRKANPVHMGGLEILKPGILSQIQDMGRIGNLRYGVSRSGVMDPYAAAWANRLVHNRMVTPLIEVTLGGMQLRVGEDTWLAVTGAAIPLYRDGVPLRTWSRFKMQAGQVLSLGFASSGQRAYIAVHGGFSIAPILGSTATHQRNRLGGAHGDGRSLEKGDMLSFATDTNVFKRGASTHWNNVADYVEQPSLRVLCGGDAERFSIEQINQFFSTQWEIAPESDRMGVRLTHDEPLQDVPKRKLSLGIIPGAIQMPPSGKPIVLMSDCQTMGGYPLIGWLHPLDRGHLSQVSARKTIQFVPVDIKTMQEDMRRFFNFFEVLP